MSVVDRINRWVAGRLRRRPSVSVEPQGFRWTAADGGRFVSWLTVRRVLALNRGAGLESTQSLAIELSPAGVIVVDSEADGWTELLDGLGTHLPLRASAASWQARLLAEEGATITLYDRAEDSGAIQS